MNGIAHRVTIYDTMIDDTMSLNLCLSGARGDCSYDPFVTVQQVFNTYFNIQ
jgi:hypothetical protein